MNATQMFVASCAAMLDDCWAERIKDAIDSMPEQVVLPWEEGECTEATVEYVEDQLDREYWRMGKW